MIDDPRADLEVQAQWEDALDELDREDGSRVKWDRMIEAVEWAGPCCGNEWKENPWGCSR